MQQVNAGDNNMKRLLQMPESPSKEISTGHISLMRFITGRKASFDTSDFDSGDGREHLAKRTNFPTIQEALLSLLSRRNRL